MKKVIAYYDDWCPLCTNFSMFVQKLDWLALVQFEKIRSSANNQAETDGLNLTFAQNQMASLIGEKWVYGYNTIFSIFLRLPIFWLFIPLLWILKVSHLGQFLYIQLAVNRKIIPLYCDQVKCGIDAENKE